ncbi:MAG: zinc ribbon domain-containing protein [Myxococcaceae bacterium]
MRIQALHCPSCGAPLEASALQKCGYCGVALHVESSRVSTRHAAAPTPAPADDGKPVPYVQPDVTLSTWEAPRFELSFLEQRIEGAPPEIFAGIELADQRFALIYLRAVDSEKRPIATVKLEPAMEALRESLENDSDPGLAAHLALEALSKKGFNDRLEVAVVLFEPRHMRVLPYSAGCENALAWASSEEGRCIAPTSYHQALEKKMLREASDHFENGQPIHLAAHDLVVFASGGFLSRGGRGYANGARVLFDTLNEHLGEEPLRVVTLAKNGYWEDFEQHRRDDAKPPVGHVQVAAVRAILPPMAEGGFAPKRVESVKSRRYEVAMLVSPDDQVRLLPLHADRQVVVWLSPRKGPLAPGVFDKACEAVLSLLDRKDYGDNENPRAAGRLAYEQTGLSPDQVSMAVIQLFDQYERVKYFRAGWKQPVALGNRGVKSDGMQQFDEGGEATVHEGHRLFFPGGAQYEGQHSAAESFASVWNGGKASRLYEAFTEHWKTKKTQPALEKLARAVRSDQPEADLSGVALVTGLAST